VKILLDHCVPKPFGREFPAHDVRTAAQMGWEDLRNGTLLAAASHAFDVLLTVDKNMKREQNLGALPIAIIVLHVLRNTSEALRPFAPFVEIVLLSLRTGQMVEIDSTGQITIIASGR
jgi:predicted nuclease of predicted toxin-antitoxin system